MQGSHIAERAYGLPAATPVFETFWQFAAERQNIYFRRLDGAKPPWTIDPVLSRNRFTNVYRAADRVSQYLIKRVIYRGAHSAEDLLFRILLFKIFNRIDTWEAIEESVGEITYSSYRFERYDHILTQVLNAGGHLYSAAYIMPPPRTYDFPRKHQNHLLLLDSMIRSGLSRQVARASCLQHVYGALIEYPSLGPFLAYQYAIDINYSELTEFSEAEFVVPGPGAIRGIGKCFPGTAKAAGAALIRAVCETQEVELEARGIEFKTLWGRRLHLVDIQNVFCEVDKYSRVMHPDVPSRDGEGRKRIKQRYRPARQLESPWFPPKWGLNQRLNAAQEAWH